MTDTDVKLPPLSERMKAIVSLVKPGESVADIGCDHGYISIWLYLSGISPRCIASDINAGPIGIAEENIRAYQAQDGVESRIGAGMTVLDPEEADTAVIAGMGGKTIIGILSESWNIASGMYFVLSPQSEIDEVRSFLTEKGYCIGSEKFVKEDDKYYTVMRAEYTGGIAELREEQALFGPCLLREKDPLLKEYILQRNDWLVNMKSRLSEGRSQKTADRLEELEHEHSVVKKALEYYE